MLDFNLMVLSTEKSSGKKRVMLEFVLWKDSVGI